MNKPIKTLVSKQKRRFKEDGYDLDLSYITDRIIAMGFPAQNLEGYYRNHIDDVQRFLEERHKDHYFIYNLCGERRYDESRFHNRVRRFQFPDHNPPPIQKIRPLCDDIESWLKQHPKNVAVVHCKAGKGRTGVMICCYLMHCKFKDSAKTALAYYDDKRTHDKKGVTIPSQKRYVEYYSTLLRNNFSYNPLYVVLTEARMHSPIGFMGSELYLTVSSNYHNGYSTETIETKKSVQHLVLRVPDGDCVALWGDIRLELRRNTLMKKKERLFTCWLNSNFFSDQIMSYQNEVDNHSQKFNDTHSVPSTNSLDSDSLSSESSSPQRVIIKLTKNELDKCNKDVNHKILPKDFVLELRWKLAKGNPEGAAIQASLSADTYPPATPVTTSSDDDDKEDDESDWDSVLDFHPPFSSFLFVHTCCFFFLLLSLPALYFSGML